MKPIPLVDAADVSKYCNLSKEVIIQNVRIAEFMGYRYIKGGRDYFDNLVDYGYYGYGWVVGRGKNKNIVQHDGFNCYNHQHLNYHESWNELIPVMRKLGIKRTGINIGIAYNTVVKKINAIKEEAA